MTIDLSKLDAPVEPAPAAIGHNQPPSPTIERAGSLIEAAARVPEKLANEEQAGRVQESCQQLVAIRDALDDELAKAIEPHQLVIDALRIQYGPSRKGVADALKTLREKVGAWFEATGRRSVKGDLGKRAMAKHDNWVAEIIDPNLALASYANNDAVKAAGRFAKLKEIAAQATRLAKQVKSTEGAPPGLKFLNKPRVQ